MVGCFFYSCSASCCLEFRCDVGAKNGQKQVSPVLPSLNKKGERGMIGTDNGALSVDDLTCFVAVLVDERLVVLGHATERHTHA